MSGTTNDNESYKEWMTVIDTTSGLASHNEWQRMTATNEKW